MANVIFCGIVKNTGKTLKKNLEYLYKVAERFKIYKIIIYENNSRDNTKQILNTIKNDKNVKVIMEDFSDEEIKKSSKVWAYTKITGSDHPCRIEQISNARNKIVEEINKGEYDNFDVVVWIDLDSLGFHIDEIEKSVYTVKNNEKIVLTGNSQRYYDYYALRYNISNFNLLGPELVGDVFWKNFKKISLQKELNIEVLSAFNGIGVYHKNVFKKYKYDFIINDNVKEMYKKIIKNNNIENVKKYIETDCNKFPGGIYDETIKGFWKNNSGYDNVVICEHVCLHAALINNNYKIFINPKLFYNRS